MSDPNPEVRTERFVETDPGFIKPIAPKKEPVFNSDDLEDESIDDILDAPIEESSK